MRILVDADACPVKTKIVEIAKKHNIKVLMFFDNTHIYEDKYSKIYILDKGQDSVDIALINKTKKNDIIITQDYGLACIGLARKAKVMNQHGLIFTNQNINSLLTTRYINKKMIRSGHYPKNKKKDKYKNTFRESLIKLIKETKH